MIDAPYDEEGRRVQMVFSILDARTVSQIIVDSVQSEPMPRPQSFSTGELVDVAVVRSEPVCTLKALFLPRRDVVTMRNLAWHARGDLVQSVPEPWRRVLTYGRAGNFEMPAADLM